MKGAFVFLLDKKNPPTFYEGGGGEKGRKPEMRKLYNPCKKVGAFV